MEIRPARPADYDAYARLFGELGVDEAVPARDRFIADLAGRMFVADDGEVVGYVLYEVLDGTGYVRNIVSDPARRRGGIGRALMEAARTRFLAARATCWCLNVKESNHAALGLYRAFGMTTQYRTTVLRFAPSVVLPAPDPALALVPVPPASDAIVERMFSLIAGQLASARAKPGRMVLQLVGGDEVLGVGVFMPAVPGSFPFRLRSPEHAATFVSLLRAHTPTDARFLQVSAEGDAALVAAARALGAYVHLELLHMHGALA